MSYVNDLLQIPFTDYYIFLANMSVFRAIPSLKAQLIRNRASFQNLKSFSTSKVIMACISDVIKHDHREIKEYYQNIIDANDVDTKTKWQNQFAWELARHSIGEELVVYPAMEKYLGDKGTSMAEKDRKEHQVVCPLLEHSRTVSSIFTQIHFC